ncbi:hypothetical protein UA08_07660 [Talaromyces atroroseus]|uniref:AB hydrolase-1 domain-containing protein n=1 Tax=Talaromyces atroroseus TaxID=1441469 RepID=A0A225AUQ0_TALAT|nr:hypothetical protein UA08_07660 [Talaromyces atroroseus]OKL57197.1 hypothetical protein UA08_07660 [Talaromyces atroroseus]
MVDAPKGPFKLVTVNTAPERAKRLIGRLAETLKDRYTIIHIDNAEKIEEVEPKVKEHQPDVLFCASMWTAEEAKGIIETAKRLRPGIKTHAIPHGLQVERGPDAIVEYLVENVPKLLDAPVEEALARDLNRDIYVVDLIDIPDYKDLRNHGDSPHAPEHTYSHLAEDVDEFIKEHNLGKTVLIGHSMGAKVAMVLALQSPETTAGVIPVDNAPVNARLGSPFQDYINGMKEISANHVTKQSEADQILSKYEPSLPIRQFLLTNLVRDPESDKKTLKFRVPLDILGSALQEMANFPFEAGIDADVAENGNDNDLPTYSGPTLFVRGLQSRYISDRKLPACKKFFPNAQIVGIDAGHWVISEKPEEFRQAVLKFFRESDVE